jgi:hypothetical protein
MEATTIDFGTIVAKPGDLPRAVEALRRQYAGAIATESVRLSEELERVKPALVPAPRRQRRPSLKTIVRQARAAGAVRVEYGEAMIYLTEDGRPQAANSNAAERNEWDEKYGHH